MLKRKVALFGASFDPPTGTSGHGGIISYLSKVFPEVWLIPVYQHPFLTKRKRTPYEHRLQMLNLQFGALSNVTISNAEKELFDFRENLGLKGEDLIFGTYDLIEFVKNKNPDCSFHFVLGFDALLDLIHGKWLKSSEMMKNVQIIAIEREGVPYEPIEESNFKAGIEIIKIPGLTDVSSTTVRQKVADNEPFEDLVDGNVADYIKGKGLYSRV